MTVYYLTTENLLRIAEMLGNPLVRDGGLLDSAAHRPQATVFGEDAYPDLHTKAAALLESLVRNHPLVDGNKRLGWMAVYVFYRLNGYRLDAPESEAYTFMLSVAGGQTDLTTIASTLAGWAEPEPDETGAWSAAWAPKLLDLSREDWGRINE